MTTSFVTQYPEIVLGIIMMLLATVGWMVRDSFKNLTAAITSLQDMLKTINSEIGMLKDRMIKVETRCDMQRAQCPHSGTAHHQQNPYADTVGLS